MTSRPADVQDIVERLRETAGLYLACMEDKDAHCSKIIAAADEIERLRAAQAVMRHLLLEAVLAANIHREGGNWNAVMPMEEWLDKSRRTLSQESAG